VASFIQKDISSINDRKTKAIDSSIVFLNMRDYSLGGSLFSESVLWAVSKGVVIVIWFYE
jgi:hypothetical protein